MMSLAATMKVLDLPPGYYAVRLRRHWTCAKWEPSRETWVAQSARRKGVFEYDADYWDEVAERVA
jgi:hypothetical protein